jgi:hypothetical protein
MMYRKIITRISFLALAFLTILSTLGAIAAANAVPVSYAMDTAIPIDQSQFLPPLCAGMIFDNIIVGSGDINGGPNNDLIYGSPGDPQQPQLCLWLCGADIALHHHRFFATARLFKGNLPA